MGITVKYADNLRQTKSSQGKGIVRIFVKNAQNFPVLKRQKESF